MEKACIRCDAVKDVGEFYRHKGRLSVEAVR